jgi:plastocyanin
MVVVEAANRELQHSSTLTKAGKFHYFCILHPNMVGTVSVS